MTAPFSSCCHAPVVVAGERTTHWYACSACRKPTDAAINQCSKPQHNAAELLNSIDPG